MRLVHCWSKCKEPVTHEWFNSKGDSLFLCDGHFEQLALVHDYEVLELGTLTKVKVLPMEEVSKDA